MTKKLMLLLILIAMLLSSCIVRSSLTFTEAQTQDKINLLTNPSFNPYSLDPQTALRGWRVDTDPPDQELGKIVIDTANAMDGKTSVRIDASDHAVILISDSFEVIRYGGYYISSAVRSNSPEMPEVELRFIAFKENGKIYNSFKKKIKTQPEWSKESISAGFIRPGVKRGRVAIMIPPFEEGSVWIDDAGCWKVHHFRSD
ncbi:MAG: hypothetical protein GX294_04610 [Candidatus Cloacimonetes bacterium]|nr:hypothetical protein [Candidatus Cloacimonadota bacterium]